MNRNLLLVSLSLLVWGAGEGLFIYFQPLYLQQWGASPLLIGEIYGAMGIAMTIAPIPVGYFSDHFGYSTFMWASWILGTVATAIMALANSLPIIIVGMILYGLTGAVLAPMYSYITTVRGDLSVGRALTFSLGLYNIGAVLGPVLGGLIAEKLGLKTVYALASVIFLVSTVMIFFVHKNPQTHYKDLNVENKISLLKNQRLLILMGMAFITIFALFLPQPLTANYLQNQHGFTYQIIGYLGAVGSLGNAVIMLTLGNLNARIGFIIGQFLTFLFALVFLKASSTILFGIGYFFLGGYRLCQSMIIAIARPLIHPKQTGLAYGLVETSIGTAIILAPVLAGFLYEQDPYSIYRVAAYFIAAVILLNSFLLLLMKDRGIKNVTQS